MKTNSVEILTGRADSEEVLQLLTNDIQSNYYIDKADLLINEVDVKEPDIRKFKVTIAVEEI
jgi:hypothetical protein